MNILVSNDDGIQSIGLLTLVEYLQGIGDVTVVAPNTEKSTTSHSLSLLQPIPIYNIKDKYYAVGGTPADCVYLGIKEILKTKPNVVVSGINLGANIGTDIYYSGTVAAARQGVFMGVIGVAVSLCLTKAETDTSPHILHWETAANFVKKLLPQLLNEKQKNLLNCVLNINVPNLPMNSIRGARVSSMMKERHYHDDVMVVKSPRGENLYWLGGPYKTINPMPHESDGYWVNQGYISITPLKIDSTDTTLLSQLKIIEDLL